MNVQSSFIYHSQIPKATEISLSKGEWINIHLPYIHAGSNKIKKNEPVMHMKDFKMVLLSERSKAKRV